MKYLQAREEELLSRKRALQTLVSQHNVPREEDESSRLFSDMDKVSIAYVDI